MIIMRILHPYPQPSWHDSSTATDRCGDVRGAQGWFSYGMNVTQNMPCGVRYPPKFDINTLNMMVWNMREHVSPLQIWATLGIHSIR